MKGKEVKCSLSSSLLLALVKSVGEKLNFAHVKCELLELNLLKRFEKLKLLFTV
jgi:hypothetical protein